MFEWVVREATTASPQPTGEPPQLADVLNSLEQDGWEIFSIVLVPVAGISRFKIVARRAI